MTKQRGFALLRPRESNAEKRKCFNLEEVEEIKRKRQMLKVRWRVENVSLKVISIIKSKFVIV